MSDRDREAGPSTALRWLASAEPPAGMEQRILRCIREKERAAEVAFQRPWQSWLVAGLGTCVAVMVAMASMWRPHPTAGNRRVERAEAVSSSDALGWRETVRPPRLYSEHPARRYLHLQTRDKRHAEEVSLPAPPAPLTQQERLLLRVSKAGAPAEAAAEQALLHEEPAELPGEPLPSLPHEIPGHPLPALASEALGHPLPNFFEAMKTGDQP